MIVKWRRHNGDRIKLEQYWYNSQVHGLDNK